MIEKSCDNQCRGSGFDVNGPALRSSAIKPSEKEGSKTIINLIKIGNE
jgi:hypothetical protein